jgi:hypothetical protein
LALMLASNPRVRFVGLRAALQMGGMLWLTCVGMRPAKSTVCDLALPSQRPSEAPTDTAYTLSSVLRLSSSSISA